MKFCSCCDGSCVAQQEKIDEEQAKEDAACGEKGEGPLESFFNNDILQHHNEARAKHQDTPAMTWDYTLQGYAQTHCDKLADERAFYHSQAVDRGNSGENLYKRYGSQAMEVCQKVGSMGSQGWYDEIEFYDYATGGKKDGDEGEMIGHFTQQVWVDSIKLGCAYSLTSAKDQVIVCCNYSPPGNYNRQYLDKVKPLIE